MACAMSMDASAVVVIVSLSTSTCKPSKESGSFRLFVCGLDTSRTDLVVSEVVVVGVGVTLALLVVLVLVAVVALVVLTDVSLVLGGWTGLLLAGMVIVV